MENGKYQVKVFFHHKMSLKGTATVIGHQSDRFSYQSHLFSSQSIMFGFNSRCTGWLLKRTSGFSIDVPVGS